MKAKKMKQTVYDKKQLLILLICISSANANDKILIKAPGSYSFGGVNEYISYSQVIGNCFKKNGIVLIDFKKTTEIVNNAKTNVISCNYIVRQYIQNED